MISEDLFIDLLYMKIYLSNILASYKPTLTCISLARAMSIIWLKESLTSVRISWMASFMDLRKYSSSVWRHLRGKHCQLYVIWSSPWELQDNENRCKMLWDGVSSSPLSNDIQLHALLQQWFLILSWEMSTKIKVSTLKYFKIK